MRYQKIVHGTFIERPNRFIAYCEVDGKREKCHVKNTGRCKEILVEGCKVILSVSDNPERKTKYDVIAAYKGERLINIDSQVPNDVAEEALIRGLIPGLTNIRREVTHGDSRIDICAEGKKRTFIEVKGVTLEKDGVVMFPDAPTERGVKHLNSLMGCVDEGNDAYILLVIQMSNVDYFIPNYSTHEEFGIKLKEAADHGVHVLAYDCDVTEDSITLGREVEVRFRERSS